MGALQFDTLVTNSWAKKVILMPEANFGAIWTLSFYKTMGGQVFIKKKEGLLKPENDWSCIAHLIAEHMLKSAVIEEKTFKHSPWAGADDPLGPKF